MSTYNSLASLSIVYTSIASFSLKDLILISSMPDQLPFSIFQHHVSKCLMLAFKEERGNKIMCEN